MLQALKRQVNLCYTENGAATLASSGSACLDMFSSIGALRKAPKDEVEARFLRALAENPDWAMKILFYGRDIRSGLGERKVFRILIRWLAYQEPRYLRKNLHLIPEYGRWDDILAVMGTPCEADALALIREQLQKDLQSQGKVSLLGKWLPSVNTSNREAVAMAKHIARSLHMTDRQYRKNLSALRSRIRILENNLRQRNYTFDYAKQPSRALFHYRKAFLRNDFDRYHAYLDAVSQGKAAMHTAGLMPYDIVSPCLRNLCLEEERRQVLDVTWNALEDFGSSENALAVIDVSGSMFWTGKPTPAEVAVSLGIYLAEHNTGLFRNHIITFSDEPELVEIQGKNIFEKVWNCVTIGCGGSTNLEAVFRLILDAAVQNRLPQSELPQRLYIISDMEFNCCARNASLSNFENAKAMYEAQGYRLPEVIFWNVQARNQQSPVKMNETGAALVSGCSPRIFSMMVSGVITPMTAMMHVLNAERYAAIAA